MWCKNLRRSHDNRLVQEINRKGYFLYTHRCIKLLNSLSVNAVSAQTINSFKAVIVNEVFGMVNGKVCQSLSLYGLTLSSVGVDRNIYAADNTTATTTNNNNLKTGA